LPVLQQIREFKGDAPSYPIAWYRAIRGSEIIDMAGRYPKEASGLQRRDRF
jgi:hypothetical protein